MRVWIMAALLSLATIASVFADESVAGHWKAALGSGLSINMQIAPDGKWSSETWQNRKLMRQMAGTYTQTPPSGSNPGELVFTPTSESAGSEKAETETDSYTLAKNGQELRLTSGGDTMVFRKQQH